MNADSFASRFSARRIRLLDVARLLQDVDIRDVLTTLSLDRDPGEVAGEIALTAAWAGKRWATTQLTNELQMLAKEHMKATLERMAAAGPT